jgi:hypothetical protein
MENKTLLNRQQGFVFEHGVSLHTLLSISPVTPA